MNAARIDFTAKVPDEFMLKGPAIMEIFLKEMRQRAINAVTKDELDDADKVAIAHVMGLEVRWVSDFEKGGRFVTEPCGFAKIDGK